MLIIKLLLVCSSPFRRTVKFDNITYTKGEAWNLKFYLYKLLLMIFPLIAVLIYYSFNKENQDIGIATAIYLLVLFAAMAIIHFAIPDDILEKISE